MGNETKTVISVECIDQTLRMTQAPTIASGGVKENAVEFTFGALWDDLILFAVFYRKPSEVYHVRIEDGRCIVPREVTRNPGCFFLGVMGAKDGVTRTSTVLSYRVEAARDHGGHRAARAYAVDLCANTGIGAVRGADRAERAG